MSSTGEAETPLRLLDLIMQSVPDAIMNNFLLTKVFSTHIKASHLTIIASLACILVLVANRYLSLIRFHRFTVKNGCADVTGVKQFDKPFGLGLIIQMVRAYQGLRYLEWWQILSTELGHTFTFWLFGQRIYVTADPENIKTIFSTSFETFEHGPTRQAAGRPLAGNGIFAADGETWSAARALLRPSFAKAQINDLDMLEHHFQNFLHALPAGEDLVDLQEMFKWLSQDVITDMLFGSSTESLMRSNDKEAVAFSRACEYSQKVAFRNVSLGWIGPLIPDLKDWKARRLLHKKVNQIVRQVLQKAPEKTLVHAESSKKRRYVFLEHLVERTRDPDVLRDQLMSGMLGGRDTTSSLLSNLFYTLARRPDIWKKLKAEIDRIEAQPPKMGDILAAKYARNCLQESLRLHPVVPINQRWASKDAILPCGGNGENSSIAIPQGSNVYIPVYALHRRTDIYGEDANEFRPERWDENLKPGWGFMPFGGGPRLCIGQEFALTEAMFFLIRMLQVFDHVVPEDDEPFRENMSLTLNSASGCKVFLSQSPAE